MKHLPDARGKNAVIDYLKALRAFFHWAEERGYSTGQPFRGFAIGTAVYGTPYYLTIEERERIYRTNLSRHPSLDVQKDIFVFQCLVGCRVGDLIRIKKTDVLDDVLTYIPRKTIEERPAVVRVPLNNTAKEIIRRYDGLAGEKLLPFISPQKYNEALKKIFLAARITRLVAVLDPLTRKEVKRPLNEWPVRTWPGAPSSETSTSKWPTLISSVRCLDTPMVQRHLPGIGTSTTK